MSYSNEQFWSESKLPIQRISYYKKKAKNFEWAEKCADYYDYYHGGYHDKKRIDRLKLNYSLYNGDGDKAMDAYSTSFSGFIPGDDEYYIDIEGNIRHHSVIDQIAKSLVGEQQARPLTPMAIDTSGYAINYRKKKRLELLQAHINHTILQPLVQQATLEVMMKNGITDPYSLSPEEQQQFQSEIDQRTQQLTPKEIENYMRSEYKSPSEIQAQKLIDYLISEHDIKFVTDQGFKHAIITGEEIYYIGIRHDKPVFNLVNPIGFTYSSSPNSFFIEDGEWAKYEENIKFTDFFNQYGDQLSNKDLEKLSDTFFYEGSRFNAELDPRMAGAIAEYDSKTGILSQIPDIRTNKGQEQVKSLYSRFGSEIDQYSSIRKVHVVWKSLRKLKRIHRYDSSLDKVNKFWVDESYRFNPVKGDIKEDIAWVPEVWQAVKFGTMDAIYVDKEPLPYQYRSIHNPWDVKLPYVGAEYNKLFGNAENVSPIDLGKPWQYKFNVQMARIHEMEATDVGKILVWAQNAKPKDMPWNQFLMMMKYGKLAVVDTNQEGFTPFDTSIIKGVDLSTINDLAGKLQYLEFLRNQIAISMSYNPSRLGQVAPYTAVTNNQQSIIQSSYQTEDIFTIHNKIVENSLGVLLRAARCAFKNNEFARSYLLDDMSVAELEVDWEVLDTAELGIKVRNSSKDFNNIQKVKELGQAMIQNGLISFPELIRLQWATSGAEVFNIAEQAEEKAQKLREQQSQKEQELLQQQAQIQKELADLSRQFELEKQSREHEKELLVAQIAASRFAQQADINMNQINDSIEEKREEIAARLRELDIKLAMEKDQQNKDRELNRKIHEDEVRLKEHELRIKEIMAKKPKSTSKSN